MNDTTLIHLVSQQTMQNLLPILALRPRKVVQVLSGHSRFPAVARDLERALDRVALASAGGAPRPECETVPVPGTSPGIEQTAKVLHGVADANPDCILNITGGTKLMSIAAWQVATGRDKPWLYCDTQMQRFVCTPHPQLSGVPPFDRVVASLTVDVVMAAHGAGTGRTPGTPLTPERLAFGRETYRLRAANPA
ncbi:MAG: DUF1887 family protein, partial [Lentisphaeria bacterium]|nr:DUF1887 family protein [Lentisphaeria bacterium]